MFTRHVIMELKLNATTEFTNVVESKTLPLLRKQKGFRDFVSFVAPDRSEAIAITFWDSKEEAEAYNVSGYPEVLKTLTSLVEGTPRVGVAELASSTLHKLANAKTRKAGVFLMREGGHPPSFSLPDRSAQLQRAVSFSGTSFEGKHRPAQLNSLEEFTGLLGAPILDYKLGKTTLCSEG